MPDNAESEAFKLHSAALVVHEKLKSSVESFKSENLGFQPRHSFSSRVKSDANILEKIDRKRSSKPGYGLKDVTDVVGIRFIALFKRDIPAIMESIFNLIKGNVGEEYRGPNELLGARLHELIQYISLPSFMEGWKIDNPRDNLSDRVNDLVEDKFSDGSVKLKIEPRINYSGVHIVIFIRTEHNRKKIDVPVEIQLRTVFENAWGEVDHLLFFEEDRKGGNLGDRKRQAVGQHLSILKRIMDTATDYAAIINDRNTMGEEVAGAVAIRNLDGADYIREVCERVSFPRELEDRFLDVVRRKEKLDTIPGNQENQNVRDGYLAVGRDFRVLLDDWQPEYGVDERYFDIFYLLRMEEAISRLLSGNPDQILKSLDLYRGISEQFPQYPTCWFRRGQSCMRAMEDSKDYTQRLTYVSEAIDCYARLKASLADLEQLDADRKFLKISPDQRNLVLDRLPRCKVMPYG